MASQSWTRFSTRLESVLLWLRSPWLMSTSLVAMLVSFPILAVFSLALFPRNNVWSHLVSTVLPGYLSNTFLLMAGTGLVSLALGISCAWLVTMCRFPGRRLFEWALLLPFAVPAYVIAYVYTDLLDYSGSLQSGLRQLFGWTSPHDYWFPAIRSLGGAILMMSLVLYPYIYMLARAAFLEQSMALLNVSRSLGLGPWQSFFRVSLPIARPAIAVGLSLVLMETLNDFGTVDFFAVKTLTAGLYDTWLNMNNIGGAAQIAGLMLFVMVSLISLEQFSRRKKMLFQPKNQNQPLEQFHLKGKQAAAASLMCLLPIVAGFVIPIASLSSFAWRYFEKSWTPEFIHHAINSFTLSVVAALATLLIGILLAYSARLNKSGPIKLMVRISSFGYAMPGAVLAVGVIIPLAAFDNAIDGWVRSHFGISTGLLLSGTLFALVFAYVVRFLAVSAGAIQSSLEKVTPSMDMAARSLGASHLRTLVQVHLPVIKGSLMTAALVVFVDCMKELPATLILRPFNFETLATYVYQYASDEQLETCALAALVIVLVGVGPVILLSKSITASRRTHH